MNTSPFSILSISFFAISTSPVYSFDIEALVPNCKLGSESGSAPILNFCTFHSLVSASCPFTRAVISDVGILVRIMLPTESSIELYLVRIAGEVSLFITAVRADNWLRPLW